MNLAHSRLTVVGLLVASLALAPAAAEGARKKPKPCTRKGSTTVAASSKLRVYEVGGYDRTVYGCLRARNRRMVVARYSSCDCSTSDEPQPPIWLNRETVALLKSKATVEKYSAFGIDMTPSSPKELADRIRNDGPYWAKAMSQAGVRAE